MRFVLRLVAAVILLPFAVIGLLTTALVTIGSRNPDWGYWYDFNLYILEIYNLDWKRTK